MITKEEIEKNLKYLNLDLENVPEPLKQFKGIEYLPTNLIDEDESRLYTYIPVSKIDILVTSHAEDDSFSSKFSDAISLEHFLRKNSDSDIDMKNYSTFLNILSTMKTNKIDIIEKEQKKYNKEKPFMVSYDSSSFWNIYYSKKSERYFMIVSTKENEFSELFYLIKKKLEFALTEEESYIYAPITLMPYTEKFLRADEILEMENNIWYFARKWPITYEFIDKEGKYSLVITGYTTVYDNILSPYKLEFKTRKDALEYAKFVKALYTLEKKTDKHVDFNPVIKSDCSLGYRYKKEELLYTDIQSFLFLEYGKMYEELIFYAKENLEKEEKLNQILQSVNHKKAKLLSLQNEIIMFSEAKKSFFGKFRYYFKKDPLERVELETKKLESKDESLQNEDETKNESENLDSVKTNDEILENKYSTYKLSESFATIEEYINLYHTYKEVLKKLKNNILDINSQKLLEKNLEYKIQNAIKYLEEVSLRKKNIVSFFKYTNSANLLSLTEAEKEIFIDKIDQDLQDDEIEGVLNLEFEYDTFGYNIDLLQRKELTKEEIDAIYISTVGALKYLNMFKHKFSEKSNEDIQEIDEQLIDLYLRELKQEYEEIKVLENENFDIFGGLVGQKVRYIKDKAFRETKREKFTTLKFSKDMTREELINKLNKLAESLKTATDKIKIKRKIELYKVSNWSGDLKHKNYDIYNLNLDNEVSNIDTKDYTYNIFKITMHKGMNMLFYTNNIFYGNQNETLPLGMDISSQVLVDMSRYTFILRSEDKVKVAVKVDDGKMQAKTFNIKEYRVVEKELLSKDIDE